MKKLDYISIFKFLAITLVVIGHLPNVPIELKNYIYSFHMPAFFMIYGFIKFDQAKYDKPTTALLGSKFRALIIPYLIWAFIYSGLGIAQGKGILFASHLSLKQVSNSSLWFLPTYFLSVVLFDLFQKYISSHTKKTRLLVDALLATGFFLAGWLIPNPGPNGAFGGVAWGLDSALIGFALMIIGKNLRILFNKAKKIPLPVCLVAIAILGVLILGYKFNSVSYMLLAEKLIGNPLVFIPISIFGFCLLLFCSLVLERIKLKPLKKYLIFIGDNTLVLFVLQRFVMESYTKIFGRIGLTSQLPTCVVTTIVVFATLSVATLVINRYVPQLNGKKNSQ